MKIEQVHENDTKYKEENLQASVAQLKSLVEDLMKIRQQESETEQYIKEKEEDDKKDLICIEDINDEHLKLEVFHIQIYRNLRLNIYFFRLNSIIQK